MCEKISPYLMALFVALLSVMGTVITSIQTASLQSKQSITERKAVCQKTEYVNFLSRIDRKSDLVISEILSIGALADKVTTDSEIQTLENHFSKLVERNSLQAIYVRLNSDLNLLRLCGSKEVNQRAEDLLNMLVGDFSAIDVSHYPASFRQYYYHWLELQQGQYRAYVWEERILPEERASLILISAMLRQLLAAMNADIEQQIP
jgi:hypothetical protein